MAPAKLRLPIFFKCDSSFVKTAWASGAVPVTCMLRMYEYRFADRRRWVVSRSWRSDTARQIKSALPHITTLGASIKRCGLRQLWKLALRITSGLWKKLLPWQNKPLQPFVILKPKFWQIQKP